MTLKQNNQLQLTEEKVRTKRSVETGINETDFINTMFLRSSFFENWSETNYFINPTLKTSQTLTYNDKGYLDFLKDSYSTGISFDKLSDEFMDLYKNGDTYAKQYNIDKFYDVDEKQFLKELTNFFYSFANKYNLATVLNKLKTNINDLQSVNLIEDNGKLDSRSILPDNKGYIAIVKKKQTDNFSIIKFNFSNESVGSVGTSYHIINGIGYIVNSFYQGQGDNDPNIPEIDTSAGKIKDGNIDNQNKVKDFLNNYLDVIIQENIRIQQGGNPDYDDLNLGSQRIIFDFEIINNLNKSNTGAILTKKSIYGMILTIDEHKNIVAGSLELR